MPRRPRPSSTPEPSLAPLDRPPAQPEGPAPLERPAQPTWPARPERPAALFIGNSLWLDFVNTRYIDRNRPVDVLQSFSALVDWLAESGALPAADAREIIARWGATARGAEVLAEALALRDSLRDLAESLASGPAARMGGVEARAGTGVRGGEQSTPVAQAGQSAPVAPAEQSTPVAPAEQSVPIAPAAVTMAVAAINGVLRANVRYDVLTLAPDSGGTGTGTRFARHARGTDVDPLRVLVPVADSASELLCGRGDRSRVRRCGNPRCVLYFYDTTRNGRRRFCSPAACGNRVKAAARYRRSKMPRDGVDAAE